ncbi:unnamed protein product [Lampetra fluviatilis]
MIGRAQLLAGIGRWARPPGWSPVVSTRWASGGEATGGAAEGTAKAAAATAGAGEDSPGAPVAFKPFRLEGKPGKRHLWCACGFSRNQPFCDGSHFKARWKGESKKWPVLFKVPESGVAWLCLCKQTGKPPFCDGAHKKIGTAPSENPPSQ